VGPPTCVPWWWAWSRASPASRGYLIAGRHITRNHYEAVADVKTGFSVGDVIKIAGMSTAWFASRNAWCPRVATHGFHPAGRREEAQFLKTTTLFKMTAPAPPPFLH